MKKIIAIALAGLAAVAVSSCTCGACGGTGWQIHTTTGYVPYTTGNAKTYGESKMVRCMPCGGRGTVDWIGTVRDVGEAVGTTAGAINDVNRTVRSLD